MAVKDTSRHTSQGMVNLSVLVSLHKDLPSHTVISTVNHHNRECLKGRLADVRVLGKPFNYNPPSRQTRSTPSPIW